MKRVILFNWPKLVGSTLLIAGLLALAAVTQGPLRALALCLALTTLYFVVVSLLATWWVYDDGQIETLQWATPGLIQPASNIASVHVGYDDTRAGLLDIAMPNDITGLYLPVSGGGPWRHKSLLRAIAHDDRTSEQPLAVATEQADRFDTVVFGFTAHEIRDRTQRQRALRDARSLLRPDGTIVVVEHPLNLANVIAYGPGAMHFITEGSWREDFEAADLTVCSITRQRALVSAFALVAALPTDS